MMTKIIVFVGGPNDGEAKSTSTDCKQWFVVHTDPLKAGQIMLSLRKGSYQQTGEYDGYGRELFLWRGWDKI